MREREEKREDMREGEGRKKDGETKRVRQDEEEKEKMGEGDEKKGGGERKKYGETKGRTRQKG